MTDEEVLALVIYEVTKDYLSDLVAQQDYWRQHIHDRFISNDSGFLQMYYKEGMLCFDVIHDFGYGEVMTDHWRYFYSSLEESLLSHIKFRLHSIEMQNVTEDLLKESLTICDVMKM